MGARTMSLIVSPIELVVLTATFLISLGLCVLCLRRAGWLSRGHMVTDLSARQALHTRPTPRVGGIAIIFAFAFGSFALHTELSADLIWALLAGCIVFCVGFREDLARDVSPKIRLLAAFASAVLAVILSGTVVRDIGVWPIDAGLTFGGIAIFITLLWSAGTCHALNLIDGLNGLAAGYTISAALGLFMVAQVAGEQDIQILSLVLIFAILGFLILNWPFGLIFMGDAGAYAIGHILAWMGIILTVRNPDVMGIAILLILFWPVADTIFSIIRRKIGHKPPGQPDRLHFHHLVARGLNIVLRDRVGKTAINSLASLTLMPFYAVPIISGVVFWDKPGLAFGALCVFTVLFIGIYVMGKAYFSNRLFMRTDRNNEAATTSPSS